MGIAGHYLHIRVRVSRHGYFEKNEVSEQYISIINNHSLV